MIERCARCRHTPHQNACLNMASDNDCSCKGGYPTEQVPDFQEMRIKMSERAAELGFRTGIPNHPNLAQCLTCFSLVPFELMDPQSIEEHHTWHASLTGEARAQYLGVREAARRLGVHENTIRNWVNEGILTDARVPGSHNLRLQAAEVNALASTREAVQQHESP